MVMHTESMTLQLSNDGLGTRDTDAARGLLLLGVGDLAVVDDNGVASSAGTESPAKGSGELGLVVGSEDLHKQKSWLASRLWEQSQGGRRGGRTMNSSLILLALPQPDMT